MLSLSHAVRSTLLNDRVEWASDLIVLRDECPLRLFPLLRCHDDHLHVVSQCGGGVGLLTSSTLVRQKGEPSDEKIPYLYTQSVHEPTILVHKHSNIVQK